jgi:flagellar protein FliS
MYSQSGANSYQKVGLESAVMSASPHQLIVMLFDGAHSALVRARLFLEQGDLVSKGQALSHAISIIDNGLKAGLDMDVEGELLKIWHRFTTIWCAVCYSQTCITTWKASSR